MNKIKLSIAALLISGASYGQCNGKLCKENVLLSHCKQQNIITQLDSMIFYLKLDIKDDLVDENVGEYYLQSLIDIKFILRNQTILIEKE